MRRYHLDLSKIYCLRSSNKFWVFNKKEWKLILIWKKWWVTLKCSLNWFHMKTRLIFNCHFDNNRCNFNNELVAWFNKTSQQIFRDGYMSLNKRKVPLKSNSLRCSIKVKFNEFHLFLHQNRNQFNKNKISKKVYNLSK